MVEHNPKTNTIFKNILIISYNFKIIRIQLFKTLKYLMISRNILFFFKKILIILLYY